MEKKYGRVEKWYVKDAVEYSFFSIYYLSIHLMKLDKIK